MADSSRKLLIMQVESIDRRARQHLSTIGHSETAAAIANGQELN
jgi:hypothetical protein